MSVELGPPLRPCFNIAEKVDATLFPHLTYFIQNWQVHDFKPEVFRDVAAFCRTEAFWEEFHHDVGIAAKKIYRPSLSDFFSNYDASLEAMSTRVGNKKYTALYLGFFLRDDLYQDAVPLEQRESLQSYVLFTIPLPDDNPRLAAMMQETRKMVRDNFSYQPYYHNRFIEQQFKDPEFWQEFTDDMRTLQRPVRFDEFLKHFEDSKWQGDQYAEWDAPTGKYANVYRYLERNRKKGGTKSQVEYQKEWAEPMLTCAPQELREDIDARFFGEQSVISTEALLREYHFPEGLLHAVSRFGHLRDDIRPLVIENIADIFSVNSSIRRSNALGLIRQYIAENKVVPDPSLGSTIAETVAFINYRNQGFTDVVAHNTEDAFILHYARPLTREALFRDAAVYWYEHGGTPSAVEMRSHLEQYWQSHLSQLPSDAYVSTTVLEPEVNYLSDRLARLVVLRDRIGYFKPTARGDHKTFLFLHQLNGIQGLLDQKGGIYADEAGLGKTLTVGIGSFLLAEAQKEEEARRPWYKKGISSGVRSLLGRTEIATPTRVLVVGSKAVSDNWEREFGIHTSGVEVVNLTFSKDEPETGMIPRLSERKARFFQQLATGGSTQQLLLVHYDIFRDNDFVDRLKKAGVGAIAVDEAHNVKTGVLSVLSEGAKGVKTVAKRTQGLYQFLEGFEGPVTFSTGTPFVKNLREPLVMAHIVNPKVVPLHEIPGTSKSPSETNRALEPLMIRHLKKDVAGLPGKSVSFVKIPFGALAGADVRYIERELCRINLETEGRPGERFFRTLNLEIQAKLPWLTDQVEQILGDGRKVVIFTPFVYGEKRLTKDSSTVAIASHLHQAGIGGAAVLDSTLSSLDRLVIQEKFHQPNGSVRALVASYGIGGEGITLSSQDNRATHAIVMGPPNSLARYLQAIDRIHRFGQPEDVTILVPFVEGLAGNLTYDQRLVSRLREELAVFEQAIDGRFSIDRDLYQEIGGIFSGSRLFTKETIEQRSSAPSMGFIFNARVLGEGGQGNRRGFVREDSSDDEQIVEGLSYLNKELASLPLGLTKEQTEIAYRYIKEENSLDALMQDPEFQAELQSATPPARTRIETALSRSNTVAEFIFHSNLSLVRYIAKKFSTPDNILDLIEEGNIVLMRVIERFDPSKGTFGSYASTSIFRRLYKIVKEERSREEVSLEATPEGRDALSILDRTPDESASVDANILMRDSEDELRALLKEKLTQRQWEVANLIMQGYEQAEVARILGTTRQNVQTLLKGMQKRLQDGDGNKFLSFS